MAVQSAVHSTYHIIGLLLVLIVCNVTYQIPATCFAVAIPVVFSDFSCEAENLLGSNNAILYNTNLYQFTNALLGSRSYDIS
jgi:hypothetical protein